jgi:hypothetical protein
MPPNEVIGYDQVNWIVLKFEQGFIGSAGGKDFEAVAFEDCRPKSQTSNFVIDAQNRPWAATHAITPSM